jgi:hypothetical protein
MPTIIVHRKINIVILAAKEPWQAADHPHSILIETDSAGWILHFVDANGHLTSYEQPYTSHNAALWAAKAAAEFGID